MRPSESFCVALRLLASHSLPQSVSHRRVRLCAWAPSCMSVCVRVSVSDCVRVCVRGVVSALTGGGSINRRNSAPRGEHRGGARPTERSGPAAGGGTAEALVIGAARDEGRRTDSRPKRRTGERLAMERLLTKGSLSSSPSLPSTSSLVCLRALGPAASRRPLLPPPTPRPLNDHAGVIARPRLRVG